MALDSLTGAPILPNSMGVVHSWGVRGLSHMFACFRRHANSYMRRLPCLISTGRLRVPIVSPHLPVLRSNFSTSNLLQNSQLKEHKPCLPGMFTRFLYPSK